MGLEKNLETLALLKLIAQGQREIAQGKIVPAEKAFQKLRLRLRRKPDSASA